MDPGTKLLYHNNIKGEIVDPSDERFKKRPIFKDDICIICDTGQQATYDKEFIKEHCQVAM